MLDSENRNETGGEMNPPPVEIRLKNLCLGHFLRLGTFGSLNHIEVDLLAFGQGPKTFTVNGGVMHENIRAAVLFDEPESFGFVEPFYFAVGHKKSQAP